MTTGDIVKRYDINQRTVMRELCAPVRLLSKVGTVPDFWEYKVLSGVAEGKVMRGMVYQEDQSVASVTDIRKYF